MSESFKDLVFTLAGWLFTPLGLLLLAGARLVWRRAAAWRRGWLGRGVALGLLALALAALGTGLYGLWVRYRPHPAGTARTLHSGIHYRVFASESPRPIVVHVATVDLDTPGLSLVLTPAGGQPGCVPARTASMFLAEFEVQLAVNTQFFYACPDPDASTPFDANQLIVGQSLRPVGMYAVGGQSVVSRPWKGSTVYIDERGEVSLYERPSVVHHAISGRYRLVQAGVPVTEVDDGTLAPRVAIGFDTTRRQMTIMVVDGRQRGYSEGVSLPELARLLVDAEVDEAIELDGGGSATLVTQGADGAAEVLNSPIHTRIPGRERPVATHLGVRVSVSQTARQ